jgi:hypothetical protein
MSGVREWLGYIDWEFVFGVLVPTWALAYLLGREVARDRRRRGGDGGGGGGPRDVLPMPPPPAEDPLGLPDEPWHVPDHLPDEWTTERREP